MGKRHDSLVFFPPRGQPPRHLRSTTPPFFAIGRAMAIVPDREGKNSRPLLTDHLVAGRGCGPCIGCCSIYQIPALQKPKYTLCKHCTGSSCAIYDDRPDDCRKFYCLWRRIDVMPE